MSAKCLKLSLKSGVQVSPSHCLSSTQKYGSTCSFSCAHGYQLSGASSTQCRGGGTWSAQVNLVSCKGIMTAVIHLHVIIYQHLCGGSVSEWLGRRT